MKSVQNETVWLTQQKIADLFGVDRSVITKHLKNIFESGELNKKLTSAKFAQVQKEGTREVKRGIEFYNLDAIISVGYRVNSLQATHFRIWATQRLKEYIIKGFTMDDERLKNPDNIFGKDYFEEQLGFGISGQVKGGSIKKLQISIHSAAPIMTRTVERPKPFCHSAKQTSLGNHRTNGCRDCSHPGKI